MTTTYKILGYRNPSSGGSSLYQADTIPVPKSAVISTLHIANITSEPATAKVWLYNAGQFPQDWNLLMKDVPVAANSVMALTEGITMAPGDVMTVACSPGYALNFYLFGSEID